MSSQQHQDQDGFVESRFGPLRETIDSLWATLGATPKDGSPRRIAFVSPRANAGTTTIACCAAIGLAKHLGRPTLLCEANVHSPRLAAYMKLPTTPGFAEMVSGHQSPRNVIRATEIANLAAIPGGNLAEMSEGAFASDYAARSIDESVALGFKNIVFDLPPLLDFPESRLLLWQVDACVLVLRAGDTEGEDAESALATLRASGTEVLGTVLNRRVADLPSIGKKKRSPAA